MIAVERKLKYCILYGKLVYQYNSIILVFEKCFDNIGHGLFQPNSAADWSGSGRVESDFKKGRSALEVLKHNKSMIITQLFNYR